MYTTNEWTTDLITRLAKTTVGVVTCQLQRDFLNVTTSNSSTNLNDHLVEFNEDSTVILYEYKKSLSSNYITID